MRILFDAIWTLAAAHSFTPGIDAVGPRAASGTLSVTKFGAMPNDGRDDTDSIQRAIDAASRSGKARLVFPPGTYIVRSVKLMPGIRYSGIGATILRPPRQGKWVRTFVGSYEGNTDSPLLEIEGFTFDGQSNLQAAYKNYELEQAHLILLYAKPESRGRLRAFIHDIRLRNGVGDGISIYTNVDATITNVVAQDIFRGGVVISGGNSSVRISRLTTFARALGDPGGIDFEVDGSGYGGSLSIDVLMEDIHLRDGDFDVGLNPGSTVVGRRIRSDRGPFNLYAPRSKVLFEDSHFSVGEFDTFMNRITCPFSVTIRNSSFKTILPQTALARPSVYGALNLWWSHPTCGDIQRNQRLVFDGVSFSANRSPTGKERLVFALVEDDAANRGNILEFKDGTISDVFQEGVEMKAGGNIIFRQVARHKPLKWRGKEGKGTIPIIQSRMSSQIADIPLTQSN